MALSATLIHNIIGPSRLPCQHKKDWRFPIFPKNERFHVYDELTHVISMACRR